MSGRSRVRLQARGAVLLLCLFLLVTLSLLGLAAASDQQIQARINGNVDQARQDEDVARLASLWAQAWLMGLPGDQPPPLCDGACAPGSVIYASGSLGPEPEFEGLAWWQAHAHSTGFEPLSGSVYSLPGLPQTAQSHWLIEHVHTEPLDSADATAATLGWYRVLARGSANGQAPAALDSVIIARPWGHADWRDPLPPDAGEAGFCRLLEATDRCGRQAWQALP